MTAITCDITALLTAALAKPECDTTRGALMDAMQERDCWARETILPWVIQYRSNDAPRLLYAAWCEGNGEPERGEFIRVQVELAPLAIASREWWGKVVGDEYKRLERLRRRERELFVAAGPGQLEWFGAAHPLPLAGTDVASLLPWFSRGFITNVTCEAVDWLTHADAITREHPVERVRLTTMLPHEFLWENWTVEHGFGATGPAVALARHWPGIGFELPGSPGVATTLFTTLNAI